MECKIRLESFEGPLDLLLHLIRKNQIDIRDIPMALITEQYLEYLGLMRSLNLEVASEYLVMAATLVHIKSRMLLPRIQAFKEDQEEESQEDPRAELVKRLVEYQAYKEAAEALRASPLLGRDVFSRPPIREPDSHQWPPLGQELSLVDLVESFAKIMAKKVVEEEGLHVNLERISLMDRIQEISEVLSGTKQGVLFEELFPEGATRRDIILTFLALLEMVRLRMVRVFQLQPLGTIKVVGVG